MVLQPHTEVWAACDALPVQVSLPGPAAYALLHSGATLGLSLLCPSQLISPLCLCHPCPGLELHCSAGRARVGSLYVLRHRLWRFGHRQSLGYFWCTACASTGSGCPSPAQMLLQSWAASVSRGRALFLSRRAVMWSKWAGAFPWLRLGLTLGMSWETSQSPQQFQSVLFALFWEQSNSCVLLMSGVRDSHSPPVSPTDPPSGQGDQPSLCWTPGLGCPICGWNRPFPREDLHLCNFPFPLCPLTGAQVLTWLLLFRSYCLCVDPSYNLGVQSFSANFQLVFSGICSICRCIFDMFLWGGEFHLFLFCHLHLLSLPS